MSAQKSQPPTWAKPWPRWCIEAPGWSKCKSSQVNDLNSRWHPSLRWQSAKNKPKGDKKLHTEDGIRHENHQRKAPRPSANGTIINKIKTNINEILIEKKKVKYYLERGRFKVDQKEIIEIKSIKSDNLNWIYEWWCIYVMEHSTAETNGFNYM